MTKTEVALGVHKDFENIKKVDENGVEYWEARELMPLLGYDRWENFQKVIDRAQKACFKSNQEVGDHFRDVRKMVKVGSDTVREIRDWKLDRYACYLIAQNGDSKKPEIAMAQTYWEIKEENQNH